MEESENLREQEFDNLQKYQRDMVKNTPRMRSIENKEAKDRLYQDDMIDTYMKKYTRLAKQMSADYKR